jgi:hypothetical protein
VKYRFGALIFSTDWNLGETIGGAWRGSEGGGHQAPELDPDAGPH